MLRERFKEFARETESIGSERVQAVNEICDALVAAGHHEAPLIAQWKDGLNEKWQDLLELIDTRTQHLTASWHLHKFFHDCNDTLDAIYVSLWCVCNSLVCSVSVVDHDNVDLIAEC